MKLKIAAAAVLGACAVAAPAVAADRPPVESPPTGLPPHVFATDYSGCLGPLRSALANKSYDVGSGFPDGFNQHFGSLNPGDHVGTVGEEEFLESYLGVSASELEAICQGFATH
jgi:hypothetical protein